MAQRAELPEPLFVEGDYCSGCAKSLVEPVQKRLANADIGRFQVETWPETYRGRTPEDPRTTVFVTSLERDTRQDAEDDLRTMAAYLGKEVVVCIRHHKSQREIVWHVQRGKQQHRRSRWETVWSASGSAANVVAPR